MCAQGTAQDEDLSALPQQPAADEQSSSLPSEQPLAAMQAAAAALQQEAQLSTEQPLGAEQHDTPLPSEQPLGTMQVAALEQQAATDTPPALQEDTVSASTAEALRCVWLALHWLLALVRLIAVSTCGRHASFSAAEADALAAGLQAARRTDQQ